MPRIRWFDDGTAPAASERARYMTGTAFVIDAGLLAR
jgi:hypothetical protein